MSNYVGKSPIGYEFGITNFNECVRLYNDYHKVSEVRKVYKDEFQKIAQQFKYSVEGFIRQSGEKAITKQHSMNMNGTFFKAINDAFYPSARPADPLPVEGVTPDMFKADFIDYLKNSGFTDVALKLVVKRLPAGGGIAELVELSTEWLTHEDVTALPGPSGNFGYDSTIDARWVK